MSNKNNTTLKMSLDGTPFNWEKKMKYLMNEW